MAKDTFDKVLVANRGEIAIRISRTLRELGIAAVAVYSEADRGALHVAYADEAYLIGPAPAAESYLKIETLVETAQRAGAGAVHPGYGFLAENAAFARAVEEAGLVWIGPPPEAIELMGSKTRARAAMQAAGVPIIPGTTDPVGSVGELLALGDEVGYPLLIKAAAGGGGKGMEEVHAPADAERAFETALRAGAGAVHPGYGFLAENAPFARAVEEAGLVWIGPPPEAIELMGSKTRARQAMQAAGVPIIPGTTDPVGSVDELLALGDELGYPLLIKAAAGGGGKGMEEVHAPADAERAFETARRQGQSYFASPDVYVEKLIVDPRHVEVQVLADAHGNVIHLGERDCTIQRRHQKLIEETPSPAVDDALRARIGEIGVNAARAAGYRSAGTIEGLLTQDGEYFFMEMNTRIQVEHTVTEEVTGLDLVREQIRIALGEPLSLRQEQVELRGHAIECRINAEDVSQGFLPSPGLVKSYREPSGPGVRVDSGVAAGYEVSGAYDPMIAKLIVHGVDREHARRRMLRALDEFVIEGPTTLIGFHKALLSHDCFVRGETCHGLVESTELAAKAAALDGGSTPPGTSLLPGAVRSVTRTRAVEVNGRRFDVRVVEPEQPWRELARRRVERRRGTGHAGSDAIVSPMQGTVLAVAVSDGDTVDAGAVLCIVEAMKMENEVRAPHAGVVSELSVVAGEPVANGQVICVLVD